MLLNNSLIISQMCKWTGGVEEQFLFPGNIHSVIENYICEEFRMAWKCSTLQLGKKENMKSIMKDDCILEEYFIISFAPIFYVESRLQCSESTSCDTPEQNEIVEIIC